MIRRLAPCAVIAASAWAPRPAFAYRPFDQTDGDTARLDTIELELGPLQITRIGGRWVADPGMVFNYGFAPGYEFVVDVDDVSPVVHHRHSQVQTDMMVKHVLRRGVLQDQRGPSIAIELGPLLPTFPAWADDPGWSTALIISERWHDITVHVNLQGEITRDAQLSVTGGAIIEGPEDWRVRPVGEAYIDRTAGDDLDSVLVGAIWTYRESLTFDVALRFVRESGVISEQLRLGLTWVFAT